MRITCVGGGPGGLTFAMLMKQQDPSHDVVVLDREPAGAPKGWGVVFGDDMVDPLRAVAPAMAGDIMDAVFPWAHQRVSVGDRHGRPYPTHAYSIPRGELLDILSSHATALGVEIQRGRRVSAGDLPEADVVVGADGVNSVVRETRVADFRPNISMGKGHYVWLGTTKVFDTFHFNFLETPAGWIWLHAYGFQPDLSTCIVECNEETWHALGLDTMPGDESLCFMQDLFDYALDGEKLLTTTPPGDDLPWTQFPTLHNERWSVDNLVLLGDAAHTAHFSVGSGTKLAVGDAIALSQALGATSDLPTAFAAYERERRAAIARTVNDARISREWFENVSRYLSDDVDRFSALMHDRRSPLMTKLPVPMYYFLHRKSQENRVLRGARHTMGPAIQELLAKHPRY